MRPERAAGELGRTRALGHLFRAPPGTAARCEALPVLCSHPPHAFCFRSLAAARDGEESKAGSLNPGGERISEPWAAESGERAGTRAGKQVTGGRFLTPVTEVGGNTCFGLSALPSGGASEQTASSVLLPLARSPEPSSRLQPRVWWMEAPPVFSPLPHLLIRGYGEAVQFQKVPNVARNN